MAFSFFWTVATILVLSILKVNSNPPVPVLDLPENISENEDAAITCTLSCTNCKDVQLTIKANVTFKSCNFQTGNNPNVTCIVEVTQETHEKEFICEAEFKTKSLSKKLIIQKPTPSHSENGKTGRKEPVLAIILPMIMTTIFFNYLF
ncbi:unnamed protein product [Staurois parvus]|uniref:Uncharacterized protein n=1 Tax=Staurois parvus TaxID=386267 RepID=A0ABN9EGS0_9NEOB|nr:unnamed protein product [Staurois parvus]